MGRPLGVQSPGPRNEFVVRGAARKRRQCSLNRMEVILNTAFISRFIFIRCEIRRFYCASVSGLPFRLTTLHTAQLSLDYGTRRHESFMCW